MSESKWIRECKHEHIHLFFNSAMTVRGLDLMLNYKWNLDGEEEFGLYSPWGFGNRRWLLRWFVGKELEPLRNLLGWPVPHSVLRGTPRQNEPGMNRGAQTWDCGELGRERKTKEGLKDGNKKGKQYIVHKHKHSHTGAENRRVFLSSKWLVCTPTEFQTRELSSSLHCWLLLKQIATKSFAQEHNVNGGISLFSLWFWIFNTTVL